jgi:four helix bundle protein
MSDDEVFELSEPITSVYNIKHRAFYFSKDIVTFIGKQQYDKIYFSMFDQLLRSVTSIGANLVEGVAGSSKNDFLKFNIIALKSANEAKYWLCLIRDTINVDKIIVEAFIKEADEISKIIGSIIINTKSKSQ